MSDNHDIMKELFEKIEEIEKDIKELKNYYTGKGIIEETWSYDEGNDEVALLNNIKHPEQETLGKIYYIQAYYHNSSEFIEDTPVIEQGMPYKVIGINHDDTAGTVDLLSLVAADYRTWHYGSYISWKYGKYSSSSIYNWLSDTCPLGYSSRIQSKMRYMTERWREATGNDTGTMKSRQTKCKLLNPIELFGYSAATFSPTWEYADTSDYKTDFASPTGAKYGTLYPVWSDFIGTLANRRIFHDKAMKTPIYSWTNSWLAFHSSNSCFYWDNNAHCFFVSEGGSCGSYYIDYANGVAPVIRLSDKPDKPVGVKCNIL